MAPADKPFSEFVFIIELLKTAGAWIIWAGIVLALFLYWDGSGRQNVITPFTSLQLKRGLEDQEHYANALGRFYRNQGATVMGSLGVQLVFAELTAKDVKAKTVKNAFACMIQPSLTQSFKKRAFDWEAIGIATRYLIDHIDATPEEYAKGWNTASMMTQERYRAWLDDPANEAIKPFRQCMESIKTVDFTTGLPFPITLP